MPWDWQDLSDDWGMPFKPPPKRKDRLTVQDIEQLAQQDEEILEYWENFLLFLRLRLPENSPKRKAVDRLLSDRERRKKQGP